MKKNMTTIQTADEISKRFDVWRKTSRPRTQIPPELWDGAVELAKEQGIWKTARALHLDYNALKKRVNACTSSHPASPVPQFMEFIAPLSDRIAECAMEVESTRGARLRIEIKNVTAPELASIIREFTV